VVSRVSKYRDPAETAPDENLSRAVMESIRGGNNPAGFRQKQPVFMQHFLKATTRSARTQIITPQLFAEFLLSVNNPETFFDMSFRGESPAAFTASRKSNRGR
jgi:hypothetical protein